MTAVATTPVIRTDAWESFTPGAWMQHIDVRDFILRNFTPYTGDASFLAGPTARTLTVWQTLQRDFLSVERAQRVYDVDTHIPADVDAFPAGYIDSPEVDNVVVGLQTDVPLKRPMMPAGGWRVFGFEQDQASAVGDSALGTRRLEAAHTILQQLTKEGEGDYAWLANSLDVAAHRYLYRLTARAHRAIEALDRLEDTTKALSGAQATSRPPDVCGSLARAWAVAGRPAPSATSAP